MQIKPLRAWIQAFLWCASLALPAQMPEVQERILKNGLRVLLVERPGAGFIHAQFFLRGGKSASAPLPPLAAELLARSFIEPLPGAAWPALETLLKQEEGAYESLRLARLQRVRRGNGEPSPEAQELDALQRRASQQIRELALQAGLQDPLPKMGAVNPAARAEADYITWEVELPKASLRAWCSLQVEMLRNPRLPWFPLGRDGMLLACEKEPEAAQNALSILLGTALTGRTYAQVCETQRSGVEALAWSEMVGYARREIACERLVLVLVGDTRMPAKDLDETLGTLSLDPETARRVEDFFGNLPDAPGARRLQASTPRERRLLMAWRVPPTSHPDTPLLQVAAQILAGGRSSRLLRTLVAEKHMAKSITAKLGVPGGRQAGLLVLEALPEAEHALGELEQAIQGEVMRFQQEVIPEDEIRRAQRMVEADQVMVQEDAGRLAAAIGAAQCEGGDWRLAFRALQMTRDFTPEEIRGVARRYLVPVQATTALLEPDPILNPQGRQEAQLVRVLTQLLGPRLQDPAQVEAVIRETLRQIRMLPPLDQEKTLKLLESQVNP